MEELDVSKLKVADLKRELKARNLATAGNKQELIQRLREHLSKNQEKSILSESLEDEDNVVLNEDELLDEIEEESKDINLATDESADSILKRVATDAEKISVQNDEVDLLPTSETAKENSVEVLKDSANISVADKDSAEKKLLLRAQRFNTDENKKQTRAERFGLSIKDNQTTKGKQKIIANVPTDLNVLKKRAERFGTNVSKVAKQGDDREKLLKRQQRFGECMTTASDTSVKTVSDDEIKKRKRAERFK